MGTLGGAPGDWLHKGGDGCHGRRRQTEPSSSAASQRKSFGGSLRPFWDGGWEQAIVFTPSVAGNNRPSQTAYCLQQSGRVTPIGADGIMCSYRERNSARPWIRAGAQGVPLGDLSQCSHLFDYQLSTVRSLSRELFNPEHLWPGCLVITFQGVD